MTATPALRRGRIIMIASALVAAAALASCDEETPTSPWLIPESSPRLDEVPLTVAPLSDSAVGPFPLDGAGYTNNSMTLPSLTYQTLVKVEVSGFLNRHDNWGDDDFAVGPWGHGTSTCYKGSEVKYTVGTSTTRVQFHCNGLSSVDTVAKGAILRGSGTALFGIGNTYGCSGSSGCHYTYSGSRNFTLHVVRAGLSVVASDTFVVPTVGKSITFTAAVNPDTAYGNTVPRSVLGWRWNPNGGAEQLLSCTGMTCTRTLSQSGTMYVDVRVNGRELTAGVQIHAEELRMVGAPDSVFPGEVVTYTASTRFGTPILNGTWQWSGVPPTKGVALTAVTCAGGTTCEVKTYEPGEMVFTGNVGGVSMSAADSAFVKPCPPSGDPLLDDPAVIKGLLEGLAAGNPNAPDTLTGPGSREEQFMVILQRSDSSHYVYNSTDTASATACTTGNSGVPISFPGGGVPIATAHSHNGELLDIIYGCPDVQLPGGGIIHYKQSPSDSGAIRQKISLGASPTDTLELRDIWYNHYVVESLGIIFRLSPGNMVAGPSNPDRWNIVGGACAVPIPTS